MRFAQADGGMDEERIEADGLDQRRLRHLVRGGMCQPVRAAGDEAIEGEAAVEAGARERVAIHADGLFVRRAADDGGHRRGRPVLAHRSLARLGGFGLPGTGGDRVAHHDGDALGALDLLLADLEHRLAIVQLEPVLQEPGRHCQADGAVGDVGKLQPAEPARKHVLAHFGFQPRLDTRPFLS